MGAFESQQMFYTPVADLTPIIREAEQYFRAQGFEVVSERRMSGTWDISLTRSNFFKTICGLKSALKIELVPQNGAVCVKAGIGIFGQQVIPSIVSLFMFWPVLVTQIWGLVKQSKLDEEALQVIGACLDEQEAAQADEKRGSQVRSVSPARCCKGCQEPLPRGSVFCPKCGQRVT